MGTYENDGATLCPVMNLGQWQGAGDCGDFENQGTVQLHDPQEELPMSGYREEGQLNIMLAPAGCPRLRVDGNFLTGDNALLVVEYSEGFPAPQEGDFYSVIAYAEQVLTGQYRVIDTHAGQHEGTWELPYGEFLEPGYQAVKLVFTLPPSAVDEGAMPGVFALHPAHPNPFNPMKRFHYDLPRDSAVEFRIFDVSGRQVWQGSGGRTLAAGRHEFLWQGRDGAGRPLPSGTYLLRMRAGSFEQTRRMALVR